MINFDEIKTKAYKNEPMPEYSSQSEQLAYLSMRSLYNDFRKGNINKEQAQQDEAKIKQAYDDANSNYQRDFKMMKEINDMRIALAGISKEVEFGTCETCKKIIRIIDGRMK